MVENRMFLEKWMLMCKSFLCMGCLLFFSSHSLSQNTSVTNSSVPVETLNSATLAFEAGDYNRAAVEFGLLYEQFPEDVVIGNNYAVSLFRAGQHADAAVLIQQFLESHNEVGEMTANLFTIYDYIASESYGLLNGVEPEVPEIRLSDLSANISPSASNSSIQTAPSVSVEEVSTEPVVVEAQADFVVVDTEAVSPANPADDVSRQVSGTDDLASPVLGSDSASIEARFDAYINAWEEGDINSYLGFYFPELSPINGTSYDDWRSNRIDRIFPEREIELSVSELKIHFESSVDAVVEYLQIYRSNNYSDLSLKQLRWQKHQGVWFIRNEKSIPR